MLITKISKGKCSCFEQKIKKNFLDLISKSITDKFVYSVDYVSR